MTSTDIDSVCNHSMSERRSRTYCHLPSPVYCWSIFTNPNALGESRFLRVWDSLCAVCLVFVCFVTPVEVAFLNVSFNALFVVNLIVSLLFLTDMLLQFMIPCIVKDKSGGVKVISSRKGIAQNYLRTWFFVDLLSILPVDTVSLLVESRNIASVKLIRQVRLFRLVKLVRLLNGLRIWNRYQSQLAFSYRRIMLAQLFFTVIIVAHWVACVLGAVSRYQGHACLIARGDSDYVDPMVDGGQCLETWMSKALFDIDIRRDDFHTDPPVLASYGLSLEMAVSILIHPFSHHAVPSDIGETLMFTLLMFFGGFLWTRVIGKTTGNFTSLDRHGIYFHQMIDDMNDIMVGYGYSRKQKQRLREFFLNLTDVSKHETWQEMTNRMSPTLRREVTWEANKTWAKRVPYFRDCSHVMVTEIANTLLSERFAQHEYFGVDYHLYIMGSGRAVCFGRPGVWGLDIKMPGDFWGHEHLMLTSEALLRSNIALAASYVEVKTISRDDFERVAEGYPESHADLRRHYLRTVFVSGVHYCMKLIADVRAGRSRVSGLEPERYDLVSHMLDETEKANTRSLVRSQTQSSLVSSCRSSLQSSAYASTAPEFHARRLLHSQKKSAPTQRLTFLLAGHSGQAGSQSWNSCHLEEEWQKLLHLRQHLVQHGRRLEVEIATIRKDIRDRASLLLAEYESLGELVRRRFCGGSGVSALVRKRHLPKPVAPYPAETDKRRRAGHSHSVQVGLPLVGKPRPRDEEGEQAACFGESKTTPDFKNVAEEATPGSVNAMVFHLDV